MRRRTWKLAALLGVGGLMLQFSGCAGALAQLAIRNILATIVSNALSVLINNANAATG